MSFEKMTNMQAGYFAKNDKNKAAGFAFQRRSIKLDWRKIGSVNIDAVVKNLDFDVLQENIVNVAFCDIESELNLGGVDPMFTKIFKLAQLIVEYLLHSQEYLLSQLQDSQTLLHQVNEELQQSRTSLEKFQVELVEVKAESHKRKKIIAAQQKMIQIGTESYNKCPNCEKVFINQSFLQRHMKKNHPEVTVGTGTSVGRDQPISFQNELESLRERLNQTEKRLSEESEARRSAEEENQKFSSMKKSEFQQELQDLQERQLSRHKEEIAEMNERYMRQLREVNKKREETEKALVFMQQRIGQSSNIVNDIDSMELKKQREEYAVLKERMSSQNNFLEGVLQSKLDEQELRWKEKMEQMNLQHQREIAKVQTKLKTNEPGTILKPKSVKKLQSEPVVAKVSIPNQRSEVIGSLKSDDDEENEASASFGTGTFPTFGTGTLSLTGTGMERLQLELNKNPNLLKATRRQVEEELEAALEKRGINRNTSGLNNQLYLTIANSLKTERTKLAKDMRNFFDIRNQLVNSLENLAKERYERNKRAASRSSEPILPRHSTPSNPKQSTKPSPRVSSMHFKTQELTNVQQSMTGSESNLFSQTSSQWSDDENQSSSNPGPAVVPTALAAPAASTSANKKPVIDTGEHSDWDEISEIPMDVNVGSSKTRGNAAAASPRSIDQSDLSLSTSLHDAPETTPRARSLPSQINFRGARQSNLEPTVSGILATGKDKKLRNSVTFSDEIDSQDESSINDIP